MISRGSVRIYNVLQPRVRLLLKCDGTRSETRFRLSVKRTSPFKSAGASVQSTAGSRGVRIGDNNAGYIKFRGSVKRTGYPLHSPVSPLLPLTCATVCHHISIGLYYTTVQRPTISVINVADCWNVTSYSFRRIFADVSNRLPAICIEDGRHIHLQSVGIFVTDYKTSHFRRRTYSLHPQL
jgi:hypothetical protein